MEEQLAPRLLSRLIKLFPGRKRQIRTLWHHLIDAQYGEAMPYLYLHGPMTTGKTAVTKALVRTMGIVHAFVDCASSFSTSLIFSEILMQLLQYLPPSAEEEMGIRRGSSPHNFITALTSLCKHPSLEGKTIVVVIDSAKLLLNIQPSPLPLLLQLDKLTGCNVSVIFIGDIIWPKYNKTSITRDVISIYFGPYSQQKLLAILSRDCPKGEDLAFFNGFVSVLISTVKPCCFDLSELRHLVRELFPKFKDPVERQGVKKEETTKLFALIKPELEKIWDKLYLRDMSSQLEGKTVLDFELAGYAKYLILASYLASYNDSKYDEMYFSSSGHKKQKKGGATTAKALSKATKKEKISQRLCGPRNFTVDRMLAIFRAIVDESKLPHPQDIYSQISSLVALNFLTWVSQEGVLDTVKLKCNVTYDFVSALALNIQVDLNKYLHAQ